jgi:RNA polymerase sigma-70 factor (ECF subfamily)
MKLDRAQFEGLAMEHLDMLYRVARRLTRDPGAAEDLVQETYLRALRSYESFDLKDFGIRPWLLRILHNLHNTRFKRELRQPQAVDDEQLQSAAPAIADENPIGGNLWEGMDEQLVAAMEDLPAEFRTVLTLWAIEELSYKEISEALDVPIGTVMSRLHRARARLSDALKPYAAERGLLRPTAEDAT